MPPAVLSFFATQVLLEIGTIVVDPLINRLVADDGATVSLSESSSDLFRRPVLLQFADDVAPNPGDVDQPSAMAMGMRATFMHQSFCVPRIVSAPVGFSIPLKLSAERCVIFSEFPTNGAERMSHSSECCEGHPIFMGEVCVVHTETWGRR